jgi:hypothetical protein
MSAEGAASAQAPAPGTQGQPAAAQPASPQPAAPAAAPPGAPPADRVHQALEDPKAPTASEAPDLPVGTIDIEVLAPGGRPYGGAQIVLGVMASQGGRSEKTATAGADGKYTFRDLPVGSKQAYRVNVIYGGAKFSSTPFRMPEHGGYRVRVPLIATTKSDRMLFQVVGQTVIELRDDRLHITQQARLANAEEHVYVFPKEGTLIPLPKGFTAFQWQDQMSDQHGVEEAGKGFRLKGSLPPGAVTLAWAFDVKREGSAAKIPVSLPFRTYTYRVITEAPQGLELKVNDFPEPERVKDQGRDLLFTQVRREAREAELGAFTIRLEGIPGPGPGRWIALGLAILLAVWGLSRAFSGGQSREARLTVVESRKKHLLEAARKVEDEFKRGDIGPEFHTRRMDELTTELAMVLRDEESLATAR